MKDLIEDFLEELNRKYMSKNTYITYKTALKEYENFVNNNNLDWKSKDTARAFISYLVKQGLSGNSVNLKINALSSFNNYLIDRDIMQKNIFKNLKVKTGSRLINTIDKETEQLLLNTCRKDILPYIKLMIYGGLRVSEAVNTEGKNMFLDGDTIFARVIGKGNKERITPVLCNDKELLDLRKTPDITEGVIKAYLNRWSKKYNKVVSCHKLRHTFATKLVENGIPIDVVGEFLGHKDLKTTKIYVKVSFERIKKELNKLSTS